MTAPDAPSKGRLPARADYGSGCYRRRIVLESVGDEVSGELADDFHHFAVRVRHDGRHVTDVAGEDVRVPWSTCPGAVAPLRRMQGVALSTGLTGLVRHTPAREQCTHLHDLCCLAIAHAAREVSGAGSRRVYDVAVPDRVDRTTRCSLHRDGEPVMVWRIEGKKIIEAEPAGLAGMSIGGRSLRERGSAEPDADVAEATWVLQRGVFIGLGRQHDFERMPTAETFASVVGGGACHSFADERVRDARRVHGTVRDFTDTPDRILDRDFKDTPDRVFDRAAPAAREPASR